MRLDSNETWFLNTKIWISSHRHTKYSSFDSPTPNYLKVQKPFLAYRPHETQVGHRTWFFLLTSVSYLQGVATKLDLLGCKSDENRDRVSDTAICLINKWVNEWLFPLESLEKAPCTSHNGPADGGKGTAKQRRYSGGREPLLFLILPPLSSAKQVARIFFCPSPKEKARVSVDWLYSPPFLFELSHLPCSNSETKMYQEI